MSMSDDALMIALVVALGVCMLGTLAVIVLALIALVSGS